MISIQFGENLDIFFDKSFKIYVYISSKDVLYGINELSVSTHTKKKSLIKTNSLIPFGGLKLLCTSLDKLEVWVTKESYSKGFYGLFFIVRH